MRPFSFAVSSKLAILAFVPVSYASTLLLLRTAIGQPWLNNSQSDRPCSVSFVGSTRDHHRVLDHEPIRGCRWLFEQTHLTPSRLTTRH